MSESETKTAEGGDITATVQIVGYAPAGYTDFRTWANEFDDGRDYNNKKVVDKGEYVVSLNGEELSIDQSVAEEMSDAETGEIDVTYEEKLVDDYTVSRNLFGNHIRGQLTDTLQDEVFGWELSDSYIPRYETSVGEAKVKIYRRVGEHKVLKVASEREEGDRYEEDNYKRPYVSLKGKYIDVSRDDLQALDVMVTEPIKAFMMNHDAFGPVRAEECKVVMKSEGSCTSL